ncbi:ModD protein [Candidatus Thiothrix sp. Deng01]|uniref:Putative pyrophosphorylase ModD n=1 Tax=Candidatus Thiothrix phosphatis TaxID=3112415 RepID=A0ABU6CV49_9GAMM|nr:ModD protein [Candidatus Thiothrix sp. Deng01]MEB4590710.1 ModD protein [Candidatus Thiothrix sp. Deng01]
MYFTDAELDQLIHEDVPSVDLTTHITGIGAEKGVIRYSVREPTVICCTEEAQRILQKLGLFVLDVTPSGSSVAAGGVVLAAQGKAQAIHAAWRVTLNLLEYASGIATRTRRMVGQVQQAAPHVTVAATRKSVPWARKMMTKAILCGGALPHRLGLSETVLVFEEHTRFLPDFDDFTASIGHLKAKLGDKMVVAEASDYGMALKLAQAGVDMVQLDKLGIEETRQVTAALKAACPGLKVAAAGGVNPENAVAYAGTGVDMLVTSSLYFGKPADIKADIQKIKQETLP